VEGDVAVTYPKDLSWQEEALLQALFARDYPADAKAVAGDWPEGVPERVEVTAAYGECPGCGEPWPCAEVQKLSKGWEEE
jgi:hypothetical protein